MSIHSNIKPIITIILFFTCIMAFGVSNASTITLDLGFSVDDWRGTGEFAVDGTPGSLSIAYNQSSYVIPPPPPPSGGLTINVADYVYSENGTFNLDNGLQATGVFNIAFFDYTYTTDAQRDEDIANNISVIDQLYISAIIAAPNPSWGSVADDDLSFGFSFYASDSFLFTETPDFGYRSTLSDFSSINASLFALSCDTNGNNCGGANLMAFNINSIEMTAVPLPPGIALFISGLGLLVTFSKKCGNKNT